MFIHHSFALIDDELHFLCEHSSTRVREDIIQNCDLIKCKPFPLRIGLGTLTNRWDTFASTHYTILRICRAMKLGSHNVELIVPKSVAASTILLPISFQSSINDTSATVERVRVLASVNHISFIKRD